MTGAVLLSGLESGHFDGEQISGKARLAARLELSYCTKWRTATLAGGKMSCIRGRPPCRKYWTHTATWGGMMMCLKEGLGIVARVGKKEALLHGRHGRGSKTDP